MTSLPEEMEFLGREPIEEGEYFFKYMKHQPGNFKGQPKLVIEFRIDGSDYAGRTVPRYYNVDRREPNEHSKQTWKPRPGGDLVKEFGRLFADTYNILTVELTRLPIKKWFSAHIVIGEIEMVTKDSNGESVHPFVQQAKIKRLIRLDNGNEGDDLTLPCLTLPYPPQPHPVESTGKVDQQRDRAEWLGRKDRADLGISEPSEKQKWIDRLTKDSTVRTGEDIERLTGGKITADEARSLTWHLE